MQRREGRRSECHALIRTQLSSAEERGQKMPIEVMLQRESDVVVVDGRAKRFRIAVWAGSG